MIALLLGRGQQSATLPVLATDPVPLVPSPISRGPYDRRYVQILHLIIKDAREATDHRHWLTEVLRYATSGTYIGVSLEEIGQQFDLNPADIDLWVHGHFDYGAPSRDRQLQIYDWLENERCPLEELVAA